jgi:Amt family ammonium transporter
MGEVYRLLTTGRAALSLVFVALAAGAAQAQEGAIDSGDTAWLLTASAIVLMMTAPGLALFYGGLVRSKNVLNLLMQSFVMMALMSVFWVLIGYSLAFSPGNQFIGGLSWVGLMGVGLEPSAYAPTVPHQAFMAFQMMFAIITPALITGAFAERMKFSAFLLFSLLWATIVYAPLAHMVWGGGLIQTDVKALDFAGGTVVHISSGVSALVCALMIGKRRGWGSEPMPPHNLPFTVIGAALLWVGWFGFNAGSALGANGLAVQAFVTTNTAAAAAALSWMIIEWLTHGKPTVLGAASGAVAGLVAITPGAGFVGPMSALLIGAIGGGVCYFACNLKIRLGFYDDALDVVGVHGVGGTWGAIATGLFATEGGLLLGGGFTQTSAQIQATVITVVLAIVGTIICLGITGAVTGGLRVNDDEEYAGLDLSQHSESAYVFGSGGGYEPTRS